MSAEAPKAGDVWRHRTEPWRKVTIRAVEPESRSQYDGRTLPARVQVDRNTSRRKQPILVSTLLRVYVLDSRRVPVRVSGGDGERDA